LVGFKVTEAVLVCHGAGSVLGVIESSQA
jgi:hypothetical protein